MWTWLGNIAAVMVGCLLYDKVWEPVLLWVQDLLEERRAVTAHAEATLDEVSSWAESMGIELSGEQRHMAERLWRAPADPECPDLTYTSWLKHHGPSTNPEGQEPPR